MYHNIYRSTTRTPHHHLPISIVEHIAQKHNQSKKSEKYRRAIDSQYFNIHTFNHNKFLQTKTIILKKIRHTILV